jgi:hypothetical protein
MIYERNNRVFQSTLEATMAGLTDLLTLAAPVRKIHHRLNMLGATLGEDILTGISHRLDDEATRIRRTGEVPHLMLQIDRSLMRFPWELMRDHLGLLSERYALGRQVFFDANVMRPVPERTDKEIRVLVVGNPNPPYQPPQCRPVEPLPGAEAEATVIKQFFKELAQLSGALCCFRTETWDAGYHGTGSIGLATWAIRYRSLCWTRFLQPG